MLRTLSAIAILVTSSLASAIPVEAHEYTAKTRNCRPTLEKFIKYEALGGAKILDDHGGIGAFREYTIRWDSGAVERVTVAPTTDPVTGAPAVCVVATRFVRQDASS